MLFRNGLRALLTIMLAATFVGGASAVAHADNTVPDPDVWVEIYAPYYNATSDKCLDNKDGSSAPGNPVQMFGCHGYQPGGAMQRWQFWNRGTAADPTYEIRNTGSNLCLHASSFGPVVQQPCNAYPEGLWRVRPTQNVGPYFGLQSVRYPGQCMATRGSSGDDRVRVYTSTCNYDNQNDITWIRQVWSFA
ncbi:RICIN domain-containing protein [Dactylosporangium sp. NPDC005555]|uniref:RICIN domain-containing protein n=1 Tax=Dactylosporangium sp. NPDC005555 TaxID=3154889 RepID=UPI0033AA0B0A